jgi:hypothetical protein
MARWTDFVARALGLDAGSASSDAPKADAPNPSVETLFQPEGVGAHNRKHVLVFPFNRRRSRGAHQFG